jgi:hypothetical protein
MKPDSDDYYCFQWCGHMRWACVRNTTGRDCKWVLARRLGRIVPGRVESWGKYQHKCLFVMCQQQYATARYHLHMEMGYRFKIY